MVLPPFSDNPSHPANTNGHNLFAFSQTVQAVIAAPGVNINARLLMLLVAACKTFQMDYGFITQLRKKRLEVICTTNPDCPPASSCLEKSPACASTEILARKAPFLFETGTPGTVPRLTDLAGQLPTRFIGVPILFDGAVWGTMEMSGQSKSTTFSEAEVAAACFLSTVMAVPLALMSEV